MLMSIYYKHSFLNAEILIMFVRIYVNKLCLNEEHRCPGLCGVLVFNSARVAFPGYAYIITASGTLYPTL